MSDERPKLPPPGADLRDWSKAEEDRTGFESVATIEYHHEVWDWDGPIYRRTGMFECAFPDCSFRRRDVEAMWLHVHFAKKHAPGATA